MGLPYSVWGLLQLKVYGMQNKEMCFTLRWLVLLYIGYHFKDKLFEKKIWFADNGFNDWKSDT